MQNIKKTFLQTLVGFKEMLPMLLGILLIVSMLKQLGIFDILTRYLNNDFLSTLLASFFGSISAGTTINSYIIADSFGNLNDYTLVITAFLVSWVTVGIIQIPAEIYFFGKRFAVIRNTISFVFSIIIAYLVYFFYFL